MMVKDKRNRVLILGGAGFIGSNIAERFCQAGYRVVVIDGILKQTGGKITNLKSVSKKIEFIQSRIEKLPNLDKIVAESDIIIDSMAWTAHNLAILDPLWDLELNVKSHLYLIKKLPENSAQKIIYLGSHSQYGSHTGSRITEDTPMVPRDIQGVHKLTAEYYYRIYAELKRLNVSSLRFPNCFGENQPTSGEDIGLIGSFIRDIFDGKAINVYGTKRRRYLVYVKDLSEVVFQITQKNFFGFKAFNFNGEPVFIEDLANMLIEIIGKGSLHRSKIIPHVIKTIDRRFADFSEARMRRFLKYIPRTELRSALEATVLYFKEKAR